MKLLYRVFAPLMLTMAMLLAFPAAALAAAPPTPVTASASSVQVNIGLTCELKGDVPESVEAFLVVLQPATADTPMPANPPVLSVPANTAVTFPPISYDTPGTYSYTLTQKNAGAKGYTYDARTYAIDVYVKTNATSGELEATVVAYPQDDTTAKVDNIVFKNVYAAGSSGALPITGDDLAALIPLITGVAGIAILIAIFAFAALKRKKKTRGQHAAENQAAETKESVPESSEEE